MSSLLNRRDSPVSRVSATLSAEFPWSSRKARIPCAATLCGASPFSRKKSRPRAARPAHLGHFDSAPRIRQLCAKGCEGHSPRRTGSVHRGETVQPCQQSVSDPVSSPVRTVVACSSPADPCHFENVSDQVEHEEWQRNDIGVTGSERTMDGSKDVRSRWYIRRTAARAGEHHGRRIESDT